MESGEKMKNYKLKRQFCFFLVFLFSTFFFLINGHAKDFNVSTEEQLRAAIQEANGNGEINQIILGPGVYTLLGAAGEDGGLLGDLDIESSMTLRGASTKETVLDGAGNDRIFDIDGNISVRISDLTITNGNIEVESGLGGAVSVHDSQLTLERVRILESNTPHGGAAGLYMENAEVFISDSEFSGNITDSNGGAIASVNSSLEITNSTFSGNIAGDDGGAIYLSGSTAVIINSTITNNEATVGLGEGLYGGLSVELGNTIIAGNIDSNEPGSSDCVGADLISLGGNIMGVLGCAIGVNPNPTDRYGFPENPLDPVLGPLQDNGGPTHTHALLDGSPAINMGLNENCPTRDQRGVVRPVGGTCDIGAFEFGCGDGVVDENEACDDGNDVEGDGCSRLCELETSDGGDGDGGGDDHGDHSTESGGSCALISGSKVQSYGPFHTASLLVLVILLSFRWSVRVK